MGGKGRWRTPISGIVSGVWSKNRNLRGSGSKSWWFLSELEAQGTSHLFLAWRTVRFLEGAISARSWESRICPGLQLLIGEVVANRQSPGYLFSIIFWRDEGASQARGCPKSASSKFKGSFPTPNPPLHPPGTPVNWGQGFRVEPIDWDFHVFQPGFSRPVEGGCEKGWSAANVQGYEVGRELGAVCVCPCICPEKKDLMS